MKRTRKYAGDPAEYSPLRQQVFSSQMGRAEKATTITVECTLLSRFQCGLGGGYPSGGAV